MPRYSIRPFTSADVASVVDLQNAYSKIHPESPVIPGEAYLSPGFEGGQNVFCGVDESGKLIAYAPLYPVLRHEDSQSPHTLWVEIKAHPACDAPNEVKGQLLERIRIRARELTEPFPGHPIHLTFQYFPSERASIEYVAAKGCQYTESVFTMRRDLTQNIPEFLPLEEALIRPWRMESLAEQQAYIAARNECFPEAPVELAEWQYFMQSPQWSVGTTMAAFQDDQLVGNVTLFWDEAENQRSGNKIGYTEYIFVRPAWRGRNLARALITRGLRYLREKGLAEAHLDVRAQNSGALGLYTRLGYEVIHESCFYVLIL